MKVLSDVDSFPVKNTALTRAPIKVCMHVLGCARTDVRVMREATALLEAGFEVSVVDIEYERGLPLEEEISGVHVRHIILPSWFTPTCFKPWFLAKLTQVFRGTLQMMRISADIYHAHDEIALPACYIAARLRHKPLVFDAHELPLSTRRVTRWRHLHKIAMALLKYLIRYCAAVITVSPPIALKIGHHYRVSKVALVRNIPPYRVVPKSNRLRQHLGLGPETRIALYQGALCAARGLDRLIRAARFLEEDIVIIIMGQGSKTTKTELEALIVSERVTDRVKILPPVPYEELLDWTASADIGLNILPPDYSLSIRWCLPNKLFEYLMAGLPVLSSQLDAVSEVIAAHDCGRVVSSLAPADIAKAITTMLGNGDALAHMHRNALNAAQEEFQWEKESRNLVQLYDDIVADRNAAGEL